MSPLAFMPQRIRGRPSQMVPLVAGPFHGMRDSLDPTSSDPNLACLLQNCFPLDADRMGAVVGRPGFRQFGARIGSGTSYGQRSHQFTKLNGTEISLSIFAGEIYTLDWVTRVRTLRVSQANLTSKGVTFNTTGRVYCTTFADTVVISDGTHQPFSWDGTAGAAGVTLLSATHIGGWYGQPTVYYGKLFGIRRLERTTLEWSEENQPNVGYEFGGFLNVWTLGQTEQEQLFLLLGTNEQLAVFRSRSATAIGGAVTEDFKSSGTRESLSSTVGTESPGSCVFLNAGTNDIATDRAYFFDADLRPHIWVPGAGIIPAFGDFQETINGFDRTRRDMAISIYDPSTNRVYMGVPELGNPDCTASLGLAPRGKNEASCVLRGYHFSALDMLKDHRGRPITVHLTDDGYIYDHGQRDGDLDEQVWDDFFAEGTRAIQHVVMGPYLGFDEFVEKFFKRVDFSLRAATAMTNNTLIVEASHKNSRVTQFNVGEGALVSWDQAVWDTSMWGDVSGLEHHAAIGVSAWGRWCQWRLLHETIGERFGLIRAQVLGHGRAPFPRVP